MSSPSSSSSARLTSNLFFAAAGLLSVLVAMQLGSGVTQQWFESVHPLEAYAARLVAQAAWLRAIVAVDDVFVAVYASAGVLLGLSLKEQGSPLWGLVVALGFGAGLFDLEENHHMLAMLTSAQAGTPLDSAALQHRMVFSAFKWLLGPLGYGLFGLGLVARSRLERSVQRFVWAWVLPLSALALAVEDPAWLKPIAFARLFSVLGGFVALGLVFRRRAAGSGARA